MLRLVQKYRLNAESRNERKQFLGVTSLDEETLATLHESFEEMAADFAAGFYRHLQAHPQTAEFLQDAEQLERLKREQMQYFLELVSGEYGEDYFEKRLRVGEQHQRIGLDPQWYLGAYNLYIQLCFPEFARRLGGEMPTELLSLLKVILLDVGLALETYFAESTDHLRRRNSELERALQMVYQTELKAQQYAKLAGHEIRGSLNAIANACDEVAEDFADQIPQAACETISSASRRCWQVIGVVERILSDPEHAGKPRDVDVSELLQDVADRIPSYSSGKEVEWVPISEQILVQADPVGLREVFANLVSNAIGHLERNHGRIMIEHLPSERQHIFCVSDNGPGVPLHLQTEIFRPFFRGPTSENTAGRGLGLYFVRRIVEQHGGHVWVESVPGTGSRFYFSLPKESLRPTVPESPPEGQNRPSVKGESQQNP